MWRVGGRPEGNGRMFVEVYRRSSLKVKAAKSKVMVLNGEEELECEVNVGGVRFEYM